MRKLARKKLTIKRKKFADNYIATGNASQSYKDAGYKWKNDGVARVEGSRLLQMPEIQEYIQGQMQSIEDESIATAEEVLAALTSIARGEVQEEVVNTVMTGNGYSDVVKTLKAPATKDIIKAWELLGKKYALWTDKTEVEHSGAVQFVDDIGTDEDESED